MSMVEIEMSTVRNKNSTNKATACLLTVGGGINLTFGMLTPAKEVVLR
jgi:hypothetical protein